MPEVEASDIREFEYRPEKNELYVEFATGRKCVYFDVPAAVYRGFCNAGSFGEYLNCHIRDHYDFRELPS
jgi:hypothetical protein